MYSLEEAAGKERPAPLPDSLLRTPFPRTRAPDGDAEDDPELDPLWERVDRGEMSVRELWLYEAAGTLALCHEGCGYLHRLVVSGPARGGMWLDSRSGGGGIHPLGVGFLEWYERWLDGTLAGGNGVWWLRAPG